MTNKILIFGGLGFVYSNLIRKAVYEKWGYKFAIVDPQFENQGKSNYYSNKDISPAYLADGDNKHILERIFEWEEPDIIIWGASDDHRYSNHHSFSNLLELSKKYNIKRFIYHSDAMVYGNSINGKLFTETDPPVADYGNKSGQILEKEDKLKRSEIPYQILRTCQIYGPRQTNNGFIAKQIFSLLNQEEMTILGDGQETHDWIYIDDFCDAIKIILQKGELNSIYNITNGAQMSTAEMANRIASQMEVQSPKIIFSHEEKKHIEQSMDGSKLKSLGWSPQVKLRDGLNSTIQWFNNNQWFFKK